MGGLCGRVGEGGELDVHLTLGPLKLLNLLLDLRDLVAELLPTPQHVVALPKVGLPD